MRLHMFDLEIQINGIGLYHIVYKGKAAPDMRRLAMLARCVQAARSWFDVFLSIELATYALCCFSAWVQLTHAFTTVYRLSLLDEPGWDGSLVRDAIDLMQVMEEVCLRFSGVSTASGLILDQPDSIDPFTKVAKSVRAIRAAWEPMLHPQAGNITTLGSGEFGGVTLDNFNVELLDGMNGWMSDMVLSWDRIS